MSEKRGRRELRAVSPDAVLYPVRTLKGEPGASLDFWTEALEGRMAAARYELLEVSEVEASGRSGVLMDLAALVGGQDHAHLVPVFPRGGRVVLVEAAGPVPAVSERRPAILAAIADLKLSG